MSENDLGGNSGVGVGEKDIPTITRSGESTKLSVRKVIVISKTELNFTLLLDRGTAGFLLMKSSPEVHDLSSAQHLTVYSNQRDNYRSEDYAYD